MNFKVRTITIIQMENERPTNNEVVMEKRRKRQISEIFLEQKLHEFSNMVDVRDQKRVEDDSDIPNLPDQMNRVDIYQDKEWKKKTIYGRKNRQFSFRHAEFQIPIGYPCENVQQTVGNKGLIFRKKIKDGVNFMGNTEIRVIAENIDVRGEPRTDSAMGNTNS